MSDRRRPVYSRRPASGSLAPFVDDFWVQDAPAELEPSPPTILAPGPSADLIVCYGDPFERFVGDVAIEMPPVHVVGPRTRAMRVRATGRTGLVIVRFRPWRVRALIRERPDGIVDRHADFDAIRKCHVDRVVEQVANARNPRGKVDIVARWLQTFLDPRPGDPLVSSAVRQINDSAGGRSVGAVARALSISDRQLRRRFHDAIGLGPKSFSRLVRFQKAVGLLRTGRNWEDVLDACCFFDQAHLIGELTAMAGITPGEVRRARPTPLGGTFNSTDVDELHPTAYL